MLSGHVRAWGRYHSRILDRWAANTGRSEGATAEKAVPFPGAVRRSQSFLRSLRSTHFTGRIDDARDVGEEKIPRSNPTKAELPMVWRRRVTEDRRCTSRLSIRSAAVSASLN